MRYVVLHHTGVERPHFDLMFESEPGAQLTTIRCGEWPIQPSTQLERLPDHRRAYLEYEGPLSGDRGAVKRIASGVCTVELDFVKLDNGVRVRIPARSAGA